MVRLRSLAFNIAFYVNLIVQMLFWTPFYFLAPRKVAWFVPKFWSRSSLWLQKVLAGTDTRITGMENLPDGPFILAPKHQSFWDAIAFFPFLDDPLYILKRELMWIPFFGWYVAKMRMIPVDRGKRAVALRAVIGATNKEMARNPRQLIIYPEGTRRAPGDVPNYKYGIVELYAGLNLPVVPVAHMAGLYWPRRRFGRFPGTIEARFLPAIEPGLAKEVFLARLQRETEAACDQILIDIATGENPPPMPPTAVRRLRELGIAVPGDGARNP